MWRYMDTRLNM